MTPEERAKKAAIEISSRPFPQDLTRIIGQVIAQAEADMKERCAKEGKKAADAIRVRISEVISADGFPLPPEVGDQIAAAIRKPK